MYKNSVFRKNWSDIIAILLIVISVMVLFFGVLWGRSGSGDMLGHVDYVLILIEDSNAFFASVPHFLYHIVVASIASLIDSGDIVQDVFRATGATLLLTQVYTLVIIYTIIRWRFKLGHYSRLALVILLVLLLIIAPINFFVSPERLYFGYISITIYHNPTTIFLRPFAILLFFATLMTFYPMDYVIKHWTPFKFISMIVLFATLSVLATLAKPSYTIVIVPAAMIIALWRGYRKQYVNWRLLIGGIVLPSALLIGYQTFIISTSTGIDLGMPVLRPFELFNIWATSGRPGANEWLGLKFLLSIAFPLTVYVAYWRRATRSIAFNLAFLAMGISSFYAYFIVYQNFAAAGDFIWGSFVCLFILFVVAIIFLFRIHHKSPVREWINWQLIIVSFVFILHVLAGINWYVLHVLTGTEVLSYFY